MTVLTRFLHANGLPLLPWLARPGARRDVAILTLGTAVAQGLIVASTPLLSRLYAPDAFGRFAVFTAVAGVLATTVTLRYETAVLVPERDNEAATLVLLAGLLAVSSSLVLGVLAAIFPARAYEWAGLQSASGWLPLAVLLGGALAVGAVAQNWLNRHGQYAAMAKLRLVQSAATVVLSLGLGLMAWKQDGLLVAQVVACIVAAGLAAYLARAAAAHWRAGRLLAVGRRHRKAPLYLLPTSMLDAVTLQLPVLLIAWWFGEALTGQFSMAWRMLMLPMSLIGGAVGQVFLQRFARAQSDPRAARELLRKTWWLLFVAGVVPLTLVMVFGAHLFTWVLGEQWHEAGIFAATLAPMALAMFVSSPTSGTFVILGLQKYSLIFAITVLIYRPASIAIGYMTGDLLMGLKIFCMFEIVQIMVYQLVAWRRAGALK